MVCMWVCTRRAEERGGVHVSMHAMGSTSVRAQGLGCVVRTMGRRQAQAQQTESA